MFGRRWAFLWHRFGAESISGAQQTEISAMSLQNRALFLGLALTLVSSASGQSGQGRLVPAPTATQWADLAKLPDLSGTWTPYEPSQHEQTEGWKYPGKTSTNPFPWNAAALKQIDRLRADTIAG